MALQLIVASIRRGETDIPVAAQIVFSGDYSTGGDAPTTPITYGGNTAGLPEFRMTSVLHSAKVPYSWEIQLDGGYIGTLLPGSGPFDWKLRIEDPATHAELGAGAYPAALTGGKNVANFRYPKNM